MLPVRMRYPAHSLKADFDALLSASFNHPSAEHIATVATETLWCRLWDIALERGVQGTRRLQLLLKELSQRPFDGVSCRSWQLVWSLEEELHAFFSVKHSPWLHNAEHVVLVGTIRESVDSLCRDGTDTSIVRVHLLNSRTLTF